MLAAVGEAARRGQRAGVIQRDAMAAQCGRQRVDHARLVLDQKNPHVQSPYP